MNKIAVFSFILSILALIISSVSTSGYILDVNSTSFPIGFLSVIITLLVAWNIYSAIGIKNDVDNFNKEHKANLIRIKEDFNSNLQRLKAEFDLEKSRIAALSQGELVSVYGALISENVNSHFLFITNTIKSVMLWEYCQEYDNAEHVVSYFLGLIDIKNIHLSKRQIKTIQGLINQVKEPSKIKDFDILVQMFEE